MLTSIGKENEESAESVKIGYSSPLVLLKHRCGENIEAEASTPQNDVAE